MKRFVLVNVIKTVQYFVGVAAPYAVNCGDTVGRDPGQCLKRTKRIPTKAWNLGQLLLAQRFAAIRAIDAYGRVYDDFLDVRFDSLCFCGRMGYGVIWVRLEYRDVARRVARHN